VTLFADTSGFYALLDVDENRHAAAREAWEHLLDRERLVTHSYVLAETSALIQRRAGAQPLLRFHELVYPVLDVIWVDEGLHLAAVERAVRDGRRTVSLVDHASFEVMHRLGLRRAFAFDRDFLERGFELVP
jgi:predicted nucleic acid-binding protein